MRKDYSKFSQEELIEYIEELQTQLKTEKYGLYWDKNIEKENEVKECQSNLPILSRKTILTSKFDSSNNLLIEGDNFHSLLSLSCIYRDKVDFIYIDPPYNTGHEDFKYNDRYVDEEDGYRHSKWLSFMQKRLMLARELLSDNGVIFISIDDNEQANLKLLCNSIFGEKRTEQYVWCLQDKTEGSFVKTAGLTVRKEHEYIIACFKSTGKRFNKYRSERIFTEGSFSNPDNDPNGPWFSGNISRNGIKTTTGSKYYSITNPAGETFTRNWTLSKEEYEQALSEGKIYFSKNGAGVPRLKIYANQPTELIQSSLFNDVHTSITGKNELKKIFGGISPFNFPKPSSLIKRLIEISTSRDDLILDFFAGSGTTGQAVLELNKEDGGNRRFILCTNNENNICTGVTYPRLKTVITGIRPDGSKYSDGIPANLIYYKTDFIKDNANSDQAKYNLVEKVDELLCISEDIFNQRERNDYSSHYVSNDGNRHLFIYSDYYNKEKFDEFKSRVLFSNGEKIVYVFSSDNSVDETIFEGCEGIIIKPIPSKIYEIYKEIVEDIKRGNSK